MLAWHQHPWEHLVELVRHAESAGVDAVYTDGDVSVIPSRGEGDVLDGFTLMTALLAVTERIGIGTIRLVHHWNAARLAQAVATQERLFPGRVRFLMSIGGQPADRRFGLPWADPTTRAAWLDETLDAVRALWRGETVTREGAWVRLDGARVRPTPPAGRPEIEVGCGVSPLLSVVARHADRWDLNVPPTPERITAALAGLDEACAREGRSAADLGKQLWVMTRPHGEPGSSDLLADFRRFQPWFAQLAESEAQASIAAGPPEACRARFDALRALGIDRPLADLTGLDLDATHHAIDALTH